MKISVVVPARNAELFLAEALASIFGNACAPLEVIVIDDGSTDNTIAVASRFPVSCHSQPARGVSAARNAGWQSASGELLAWLDADDRWTPGRLERQLQALDEPGVDVVYGHVRQFAGGEGSARDVWLGPPLPGRVPGSMLIRRELFAAVGGFDEGLRAGEFMDWLVRAQARGLREKMLEEVCLERRIHERNLGRALPDRRDYLQVARRSLQQARRERG